ncbi:MAG: hypothetical protein ACLGI2_04040 [Acidimicrobiia bacterium]
MADPHLRDADERAHPPGDDPMWEEAWHFEFAAADGRLGGYARLTLRPGEGRAWWWTAIVGADVPFVLVREHDVAPPKPGSLEIRAPGLWAEPYCEDPFDHWSVGLEAVAVSLDDPLEAYGKERGEPVPLGLDLGWEAEAGAGVDGMARPAGYAQACSVHGDVLVGARRLAVDGSGRRWHTWGGRDWWAGPATGEPAGVELDGRGLVAAAGDLRPVFHAPVQVPPPRAGPAARLARALCRGDGPDGPGGARWAWAERLQPASSTMG